MDRGGRGRCTTHTAARPAMYGIVSRVVSVVLSSVRTTVTSESRDVPLRERESEQSELRQVVRAIAFEIQQGRKRRESPSFLSPSRRTIFSRQSASDACLSDVAWHGHWIAKSCCCLCRRASWNRCMRRYTRLVACLHACCGASSFSSSLFSLFPQTAEDRDTHLLVSTFDEALDAGVEVGHDLVE